MSWSLDGGVAALGALRGELRSYLALQGASKAAAANVVLATQEAAKNALRASPGRVTVMVWTADGVVWVRVRDRGHGFATPPSRRCPGPWSTHGRGLCLMDALMDEVHVEHRHGTQVLMCLRLGPAPASRGRKPPVEAQPA